MFGYIICNKEKLEQEEENRYQSAYCGLCKNLEKRFGQLSRISLNYDMVFLILFLSSLYEPKEEEYEFSCVVHPMHKKKAMVNKYTDYAAYMTVALTYYKCLDDWQDEHKHIEYWYMKKLESSYQKVAKCYPRQCKAISEGIKELNEIEHSFSAQPDQAVNCFGRLMSEMFIYEEDFWSDSLRTFGYHLGRFIYLMDAAIDYKKDRKNNDYNPLVQMGKKPEEMKEILEMMIGEAASQFERLPLVQDVHLLRNILYGGVWQRYSVKKSGEEEQHD